MLGILKKIHDQSESDADHFEKQVRQQLEEIRTYDSRASARVQKGVAGRRVIRRVEQERELTDSHGEYLTTEVLSCHSHTESKYNSDGTAASAAVSYSSDDDDNLHPVVSPHRATAPRTNRMRVLKRHPTSLPLYSDPDEEFHHRTRDVVMPGEPTFPFSLYADDDSTLISSGHCPVVSSRLQPTPFQRFTNKHQQSVKLSVVTAPPVVAPPSPLAVIPIQATASGPSIAPSTVPGDVSPSTASTQPVQNSSRLASPDNADAGVTDADAADAVVQPALHLAPPSTQANDGIQGIHCLVQDRSAPSMKHNNVVAEARIHSDKQLRQQFVHKIRDTRRKLLQAEERARLARVAQRKMNESVNQPDPESTTATTTNNAENPDAETHDSLVVTDAEGVDSDSEYLLIDSVSVPQAKNQDSVADIDADADADRYPIQIEAKVHAPVISKQDLSLPPDADVLAHSTQCLYCTYRPLHLLDASVTPTCPVLFANKDNGTTQWNALPGKWQHELSKGGLFIDHIELIMLAVQYNFDILQIFATPQQPEFQQEWLSRRSRNKRARRQRHAQQSPVPPAEEQGHVFYNHEQQQLVLQALSPGQEGHLALLAVPPRTTIDANDRRPAAAAAAAVIPQSFAISSVDPQHRDFIRRSTEKNELFIVPGQIVEYVEFHQFNALPLHQSLPFVPSTVCSKQSRQYACSENIASIISNWFLVTPRRQTVPLSAKQALQYNRQRKLQLQQQTSHNNNNGGPSANYTSVYNGLTLYLKDSYATQIVAYLAQFHGLFCDIFDLSQPKYSGEHVTLPTVFQEAGAVENNLEWKWRIDIWFNAGQCFCHLPHEIARINAIPSHPMPSQIGLLQDANGTSSNQFTYAIPHASLVSDMAEKVKAVTTAGARTH